MTMTYKENGLKKSNVWWFISLLLSLNILAYSFTTEAAPITEESTKELRLKLKQLEREIARRALTKKQRIQKTESNLHKLNNRHSWKKAAIGAVVAAAATATPAGAVLGGIFGGFIGRSEEYSNIEEKISDMEQDIIVSEEDFLTPEEIRLEAFTHMDNPIDVMKKGLSKVNDTLKTEVINITEPPPPVQATQPAQVIATYQNETKDEPSSIVTEDEHSPKINQESTNMNQAPSQVCYQGSQGRPRKSMSQCFYMTQ